MESRVVTNRIELPLDAYERFKELHRQILCSEIDPDLARYEMIELLKTYWEHEPEPWEATEIVLKKAAISISTKSMLH
jgi:hypothetical protein